MNVKKMFASLAGVLMLAQVAAPMVTGAATYSDELQGAYDYAYSQGITTMGSIDNANMYGDLTRGQLSKMISQWAEKEMGVKADETAVCSFTDTDTAEGDLGTYVVKACQMGLMGQGIEKFRPNDKVTRGEFGTVLSRAIWGDKYDGENPFYAKHLQALKDAGIMNNIADANATEMRGWVMLMLQRAAENVNPSECNDPAVLLACSLGSDSCPAACQKDSNEPEIDENGNPIVNKSWDLSISAAAAEGRKVILDGGTSELDTITLSASETITLNSVTLERYGFSSYKDVANIWLENANGVKIANEKSISSSKDTVTLNIKKDYRTIENGDTITVVIETNKFTSTYGKTWDKAWTNIGFKVTAVDSSAKNLDISNYSPYLYDMIEYNGSSVTVTAKGKDTKYHYESGKAYELARFQVKASNTAVRVNGFTLTNVAVTNKLDLDKYIDEVIVSLNDGTELKNIKAEANKDDELKVSFDDIEIAINKNVVFVVEATFKDLDKFGTNVLLQFAKSSDLNVQEQKNDVRANVSLTSNAVSKLDLHTYTFNGGKIEVTNTKLSDNIDAAAWASDIVIGKWKITVPESIKLNDFGVTVESAIDPTTAIETLKMNAAGEEFEATLSWSVQGTTTKTAVYKFSNVTIDESWEISFVVDLKEWDSLKNNNLTFNTSFDKASLKNSANVLWRYEDSRQNINTDDWAGSISLSKIRIQAAKWSISAKNSKDVEYLEKQTARKTIFEGNYTAQKQDVYLNEFAVRLDWNPTVSNGTEITYYLSVNGKEVGSFEYAQSQTNGSWDEEYLEKYRESFSNLLIKKGESAAITLEANVYGAATWTYSPVLIVRWEDKDGNTAGFASEYVGKIKIVSAGSVTISESVVTPKESVEVNDNNITLARFTVKSSKNTDGMDLKSFKLEPNSSVTLATGGNIRIRVAWTELTEWASNDFIVASDGSIEVNYTEEIPSAGLDVEVIVKRPEAGDSYSYKLTSVNGNTNPWTTFKKLVLASVASIKAQENRGDSTTKFTFAVDKDSNNNSVRYLMLFGDNWKILNANQVLTTVEEWTTIELTNKSSVEFISAIAYTTSGSVAEPTITSGTTSSDIKSETGFVVIEKTAFRDFFKVGNADAQVFRTK